jgi:hypothetical protein
MGELIKLVLAAAEGSSNRPASTCVACAAVGTVAGTLCAIAAVACGLAALWIYVLPHTGAVGAPLVVGGVLVALCLAMLMLVRYGLAPRQAPGPAAGSPALLLADMTRLVRDNKAPVLMAALLAGLVAGRGEK